MSKKNKKLKTKSVRTEKKKGLEYNLEKIFWNDHFSSASGWIHNFGDVRTKAHQNVSCGFVIKEDDESVVLAQSMGENHSAADFITILKNCILKRDILSSIYYDKED